MTLSTIVILALLVEAVWEGLKPLWPRKVREWETSHGVPIDAYGSLVIALVLCICTRADLLETIGVHVEIPYIGSILTGFIIYRGSNFLHDVLSKINDFRTSGKLVSWGEAEMGLEEEPIFKFDE